ncbi:hypothetical protein D3C85_1561470 [compost metagenome]
MQVDVGAGVDQPARHLGAVGGGGQQQRRIALIVADVHRHALFEQTLDRGEVTFPGRLQQAPRRVLGLHLPDQQKAAGKQQAGKEQCFHGSPPYSVEWTKVCPPGQVF